MSKTERIISMIFFDVLKSREMWGKSLCRKEHTKKMFSIHIFCYINDVLHTLWIFYFYDNTFEKNSNLCNNLP
jgi:hypothetical protein